MSDELKDLINEATRRERRHSIADDVCFPKQLDFLNDQSKRRAVLCARRSGKTYAIAVELLQDALAFPNRASAYLCLKAAAGVQSLYRDAIAPLCTKYKIRHKFNNTLHLITFPNKSTIKIFGIDSSPQDMQRLRGTKLHKAVVDECQDLQQDPKVLVTSVVMPMLADYIRKGGGHLVLAGTPGTRMGDNYFYRITKHDADGKPAADREKGWSVHEWTVPDNPHMAQEFADVCSDQLSVFGAGYSEQPTFRREWLGKWVLDMGSKVYKWDPDRNSLKPDTEEDIKLIKRLLSADSEFIYTMGCDLGWDDATAICVMAYSTYSPYCYVVHSERLDQADLNKVGLTLKALQLRFGVKSIVVDTGGGASKQFAMSLASQFELPIKAAQKTDKQDAVGRANADFMAELIKVVRVNGSNEELIKEWEHLTLDMKAMNEHGKWKEDEKKENHCFPAGTLVSAERGDVPIESISVGERVWTRSGLATVSDAGATRTAATVEMKAGVVALRGSGNHPVLTQRGMVPMMDLEESDSVWVNTESQRQSSTVGSLGEDTQTRKSATSGTTSGEWEQRSQNSSIEEYGPTLMDQSLMDSMFTIWTKTLATTLSAISSAKTEAHTSASTCGSQSESLRAERQSKSLCSMPLPGMHRQKDSRGTASTVRRPGSLEHGTTASVSFATETSGLSSPGLRFAAGHAKQDKEETLESMTSTSSATCAEPLFARTGTPRHGLVLVPVESVAPTGREEQLFNLTVDGPHEYFASGVLVANCSDSFVYTFRESMHHNYSPPPAPEPDDAAARFVALKQRMRPAHEDPWEAADRDRECKEIVRRFRA